MLIELTLLLPKTAKPACGARFLRRGGSTITRSNGYLSVYLSPIMIKPSRPLVNNSLPPVVHYR